MERPNNRIEAQCSDLIRVEQGEVVQIDFVRGFGKVARRKRSMRVKEKEKKKRKRR